MLEAQVEGGLAITTEEVEQALDSLSHKADGVDGMNSKVMKDPKLRDEIVLKLH